MQRLILIIIFSVMYLAGFCQNRKVYDTMPVAKRAFSPAALKAYRSDPQFQYELAREPALSRWDRFWIWLWNKIGDILSTKTALSSISKILIILAGGVLVYFIFKLTGMTTTGLFGKATTARPLIYMVSDEDINSINFESAIDQAVRDSNFRLAVRLSYLQSLKHLADMGLINWKMNKTNIAYIQELQGSQHQDAFRNLTVQFENNWYGDVPITQAEYVMVRNQFSLFNRELQ